MPVVMMIELIKFLFFDDYYKKAKWEKLTPENKEEK